MELASSLTTSQQNLSSGASARTSDRPVDAEEEELQRAIALSLAESEKRSNKNRQQQQQPNDFEQKFETNLRVSDDPDEVALKEAIAASLAEVSAKKSSDANLAASSHRKAQAAVDMPQRSGESNPTVDKNPPPSKNASVHQLSASDTHNISLFHSLMSKLDADVTGAGAQQVGNDRELRVLYDTMMGMYPVVVRNIEECVEKHKIFMDLHEKLTNAVRTYDRLAEEKFVQKAPVSVGFQTAAYSDGGAAGVAREQANVYGHHPPTHQVGHHSATAAYPEHQVEIFCSSLLTI